MVYRDVNPMEERHMALSAQFKSAWAVHQLLTGLHRLSSGGNPDELAEAFQSTYARLKTFSESVNGLTTDHDSLAKDLVSLEHDFADLRDSLVAQEKEVSPADLRIFLTQVRTLDDRILIEVVRFYLEYHRDREWQQERLDKVDFLLSRLAERIAGRELQGDRIRLEKVLQGLQSSAGPVEIEEKEIEEFVGNLEELRSDIRWIKSFEELGERSLLQALRNLKQKMSGAMFHRRVLPLLVEVNNAFRCKIDELTKREESRLLDNFQRLSQQHEESRLPTSDLEAELSKVQQQFERLRKRARSDSIRIDELVKLGESLDELGERLAVHRRQASTEVEAIGSGLTTPWAGLNGPARVSLVPDVDSLQPQWSELLQALSGLGGEFDAADIESDSSLAAFRLETREIEAFRRTVGSEPANIGVEQFILAGAAVRHRLCEDVKQLRDLQSKTPGAIPESAWRAARESVRIADAYLKHYSHLAEQAVFDGETDEARDCLILQHRMSRELSGVLLLLSRLSRHVRRAEATPIGQWVETGRPVRNVG